MPLHLALCLAMSPSSVICVLTHHSETRTTLRLSSWFERNLCNRSQYVFYNNNSSYFYTPRIPQGSILSSLLFLMYINDLTHSSKNNIFTICDKFTSTNRRLQMQLAVKWKSFPPKKKKKKKKEKRKKKKEIIFFFNRLTENRPVLTGG